MEIFIRPMSAEDAPAVAGLSEQLGYPMTAARIQERLTLITGKPDNAFYVAKRSGLVVGWVHIYGVHLLESPASFAEIGGLVVHADVRRQGIGRRLMAVAETWAAAHQYPQIRLRSGLHRTDAHQFYQSVGYQLAKVSYMFSKDLTQGQV